MGNCIENTTDYSSDNSGIVDGNSPRGLVKNKDGATADFGQYDWDYKEINTHIDATLDPLFKSTGKKSDFNIDWRLLAAWCNLESGFNLKARSTSSSAGGIWQFKDGTWHDNAPEGCDPDTDYSKRFDKEISTQAFETLFKKALNKFENAASRKDQIALAIQSHHDGFRDVTGTSWSSATFKDKTYLSEVLKRYHNYCR